LPFILGNVVADLRAASCSMVGKDSNEICHPHGMAEGHEMAQLEQAPRQQGPARDLPQREMYVTYDLAQRTRGGGSAVFPKTKRVYIPGDVVEWGVGRFRKRSGRAVYGVRITYELKDGAAPGGVRKVAPDAKGSRDQGTAAKRYTQVIDLPDAARNVQLHEAQRGGRTRIRAVR
jgi:hypothetical protein